MLRTSVSILCALVIGTTGAMAQDEPPPGGPPPGPHLIIPLPPETLLPPPPPEGTPEEFVQAAIGAVDMDGNGLLSAAEIHAAHEAMHEGMPPEGEWPPPEGPPPEGPPPEGPPPGPHIFIPLPPDTELPPPPPEGTPEEFLAVAIAAIDGDGDGKLSADEIKAAHEAMPMDMPPMDMPPEGPPPEGPPHMPHLFIPLPFEAELPPPPPEGTPEEFLAAAIAAIDGDGDGLLSADEIKAAHEAMPPMDMPPMDMPPMDMPPEGPPPFPHLFIPLSPEAELPPPPPEGTPEDFLAAAIAALDMDGDGELSADEIHAAHEAMHGDMPPEGEWPPPEGPPPEGEPGGPSEGDPELGDLPHPPECGDELRDSELLPQDEGVSCDRSESVGNLIFRTVCNMDPYRDQAISLPEGRAADCFGLEAIKGHNIVFQIVKEADGTMMFDTSWGKEAFKTLVLVGEPGDTVYQLKLISADEPDAAITVKFIDHPTF